MFIYPNGNNSNTPSDWVEAEASNDDEVDYYDPSKPSKPIMHLRKIEGVELMLYKIQNRFFPEPDEEEE